MEHEDVDNFDSDNEENEESPPTKPITPKANIATPSPKAGVLPPKTLPIWIADPNFLDDSLAVIRSLKPLLRKVAINEGRRLNESATVENIARTQLFLPILEPDTAPWFDIILIVDRGSSMQIWQRLIDDLLRTLRRYGAFRNVQVFDLLVSQDQRSGGSDSTTDF